MAKLSVAYGLCPLIDNNSLLGVSVDSVPDCVIVTIGKNIVIRYKFQDQKQVSSWSSKEKLTSPVVYNSNSSQYIAIFNYDQLRIWNEEDQLDRVKKYKFQEPLHSVIPDPDGSCAYILYRSGYVTSLTQALESRKSTSSQSILKNSECIKEQTLVSCNGVKYIAFTSCNEKDEMTLHVVPVIFGVPSAQYSILWNKENDVTLVGHTMTTKDHSCYLYTLWSDGSLFSFRFLPTADNSFPGFFIQKVSSISSKHPVAISSISNSHLAFFGADSSEEGAMLILLNLEFQLIQSRLHFKLYTKPPRLWNVSSHLLIAIGNNLIAVPYRLEVEQLSKLLGTHSAPVAVKETSWMNTEIKETEPIDMFAPENLRLKIKLLRQKGYSQAMILQNILPDILKERDTKCLMWCLKTFSDVPESCVVQIIKFCFSESNSSSNNASSAGKFGKNESLNVNSERTTHSSMTILDTEEQSPLIDAVLNVSVSEVCIMPYLRGLPLTTILDLLRYLSDLLERDESTVPFLRIIEWLCLLLDSHYQEYLLSHNQQVQVLLTKLSEEVCSQIECLEELKKLTPLLHKLKCGKIPLKRYETSDRKYSIETLQLY